MLYNLRFIYMSPYLEIDNILLLLYFLENQLRICERIYTNTYPPIKRGTSIRLYNN